MHTCVNAGANKQAGKGPYPELIVNAGRVLLDEGAVVGGDVPVVAVLLQHVDLGFDLLFLVLRGGGETKKSVNI